MPDAQSIRWAAGAFCLMWSAVVTGAPAGHVAQNFRGKAYDTKLFRPTGANTSKTMRSEAQGLRLFLPAARPNNLPVGLISRSSLRGDFETTVSFEILKAERPTAGNGAGIGIWLSLPTQTRDAATIAWLHRTDGEKVFLANCASNSEGGAREYHGASPLPTTSSSGRLRLTRKADVLTYAVAEGSSKDFHEVYQTEWGTADVETARFAADAGSSPTSVDVLIKDISIRADELGAARIVAAPQSQWAFYSTLAALVGFLASGGCWYWRRQRAQG